MKIVFTSIWGVIRNYLNRVDRKDYKTGHHSPSSLYQHVCSPSHPEVESTAALENLGWTCDFSCPTETSLGLTKPCYSFSWNPVAIMWTSPGWFAWWWETNGAHTRQDNRSIPRIRAPRWPAADCRYTRQSIWDQPNLLTHGDMSQINGGYLRPLTVGVLCYSAEANWYIGQWFLFFRLSTEVRGDNPCTLIQQEQWRIPLTHIKPCSKQMHPSFRSPKYLLVQ